MVRQRRRSIGGLALAAALGYLVGSFPTADVAALRTRTDLREAGSGNPGALNAAKVLGPRFGVAVLVVDMLKGALAAVLGRAVAGDNGAYAAGASAVAGHCFLPWRGFRGGKGVATSSGTAFVCFPPYALPDIGVAALAYFASRGPRSLESGPDNHPAAKIGTLVASAAFSLAATYWWRARRPNLWGPRPTLGLPLYAIATSALIAYRFMQADRKRADRMPTAPIESDSPTPAVWTGRRPEVQ